MSQVMRYEFHLFGPRRGRTMIINGHQFVNGVANLVHSSENMGAVMRVLSFYGAFAKGTFEYEDAVVREDRENGSSQVHSESEPGSSIPIRDEVRQNGAGLTKKAADVGSRDAKAKTRSSGVNPSGDGHENSGVPEFAEAASFIEPSEPASDINVKVRTAVLKLDPENEKHWVSKGAHAGKPKLAAVEEVFGKAGLTRQDIEAAASDWNRDKALEVALGG